MQSMTTILYNRSKEMITLQTTIEDLQAKNSTLEQDFENDISKRNVNKKAAGQIVSSINNIYDLIKKVDALKGKKPSVSEDFTVRLQDNKIDEACKNMKQILDKGADCITDLVKTFQIV